MWKNQDVAWVAAPNLTALDILQNQLIPVVSPDELSKA